MDCLLGVAAYLLYYIYDINSIRWKNKFLKSFFLLGTILLICATGHSFFAYWNNTNVVLIVVFGVLCAIFLGLLIYTLFFAIPFYASYVDENKERQCYTEGVYKICRHPGVLWLILLYLSIWGLTWNYKQGIFIGIVILGDILYIILQDHLIFPLTFSNYYEYKQKVPFLLPFPRKKQYKTVKEQIKHSSRRQLWNKYCSFLNMPIYSYMGMQYKYLKEQIDIWKNSELGQSILKGKEINSIDDFRNVVPLTTYHDYADILLKKDSSKLPMEAFYWIQTTWEGGTKPIKLAPYSREMLDTFRDNVMSCILLATAKNKHFFKYKDSDNFLYGLAPLPYMTGLFPQMLGEITDISFLPPVEKAVNMTFSERNKEGFKMAMKDDVHFFFGLGSVALAVTHSLTNAKIGPSSLGKSLKTLMKCKPHMRHRLIRAKIKCKIEHRTLIPKDLFKLRGFMVAGTDNKYYKDELEELWGVRPLELFAGTEPSLIGTETWRKNGMYFFPNTAFYEFIKIKDVIDNRLDPNYIPKTYLMDQVEVGETYELILSILHGGAFMRYRCGDVYKCVGLNCEEEGTDIPRFEYVDRVPWIIDVAGFTRFSEEEIDLVLKDTKLPVHDWMASKEIGDNGKPLLGLSIELEEKMDDQQLMDIIHESFKKVDEDFDGLIKILGTNPLKITQLEKGTIAKLKEMNPRFLKVDAMRGLKK